MTSDVTLVGVKILKCDRAAEGGVIAATVRLQFHLGDGSKENTGEICKRVFLAIDGEQRWRRTKRQIVNDARRWFEDYFAGARQAGDIENIFAEASPNDLQASELSATEERELENELRRIRREFDEAA